MALMIFDNYLDGEICKQISEDNAFFPEAMGSEERIASELNSYHHEQSTCFAPYMFWEGWAKSEPRTIKQQVVKRIWENNLPFQLNEVCGFEYWTRTFLPGQYIAPHVDEDTFRYARDRVFSGPAIGSIYYGPDTTLGNGSFLEIYPEALADGEINALEADNINPRLVGTEGRERVSCAPNRLIILDAGHVLHGTTPSITGVRNVMVINVWHKDNPPIALETGQFYYE